MIEYHYKNVHIEIATRQYTYAKKYPDYGERDTFICSIPVNVMFWDCEVKGLTELSFIKSVLESYLHNRLDNMSKKVFTINLNPDGLLNLEGVTMDKEKYLSISCLNGKKVRKELYNYQEVAMLDIALNKAITSLSMNIATILTNQQSISLG